MQKNLSENNFDIKLKPHYKLYVLLKNQIVFESELINKGIRFYSDTNEQPSIDEGIRYFFLDSDMDKVDEIIKANEIVANTESNLVFDFGREKKVMRLYMIVVIVIIILIVFIGLIEKTLG